LPSNITKGEDWLFAFDGWLSKLMERNKFSFRKITNFMALSDDWLLQRSFDYKERIYDFALQEGKN